MSPASRFSRPMLLARNSNCCARLSLGSAIWRSWPIPVTPESCWKWAKRRRRLVPSVSRPLRSKSGEQKTSRPASTRSRVGRNTLLVFSVQDVIGATLYDKLNYNFVRDIAPVATLIRQSQVMVVNPSFPAKTVPEFIAYAKANPGKINMASAGNGTPPHLAGALFQGMAGINMVHVPYRGEGNAQIA